MSKKNIDSGPISHLEAIFNVKQESAKIKEKGTVKRHIFDI